jgi:hypothetical protein
MAKHAKTILIIDTAWTILADFHPMTVKQLEAEDRERLRAALEE